MTAFRLVSWLGLLLVLGIAPPAVFGQSLVLPDSLPPGVDAEMVHEGYKIFHAEGMCINCHGAFARGLLGPNLTDSEWWHAKGSFLSIMSRVLTGVPEDESGSGIAMPPRGGSDIGEDDVLAVSAWVWRASHPAADSFPLGVTASLIERGDVVFHNDGGCVECHGDDATGDEGPDLTDTQWLHAKGSYLSIVRQTLMGVPASQSRSGIVMPPRGGSGISDHGVHAVAAYVWVTSRAK